MVKVFLTSGSIFAGTSVLLGAFASHLLKDYMSPKAIELWETGVKYQMYHALALVLLALLINQLEEPSLALIIGGIAFIVGIILFSGSLYGLSLTKTREFGVVTPLGGIAFVLGWLCLAISAIELKF